MNKIIKFLSEIGIECHYAGWKTFRHFGGASFYNDGYYQTDFYEFDYKGTKYAIHHKSTGRPMYWLFVNGERITARFNQRDFIELLKKHLGN